MTCEKDINLKFVEFCIDNYAPFDLDITLSAGSSRITFACNSTLLKVCIEYQFKIGMVK
jgi:hypothetical protein